MASAKPDTRRHAFAGAGASVLASTPTSTGSSLQPSPMSSSRSNPTSRTQPPHPAFSGKPGASTPPLPRSASLAQKAMRADEDDTRRNLRFVLTSADLVTIEELGENQFVLAITRPELPLPRGSPQLKRQQTIEQTMHQLMGGGAPALPQSNTSLSPSSKPAAHRVLSSPLFGNKGATGSHSSSSASAAKAHAPTRPVNEPLADAQQQRDASRAAENERLRRRAEYAEKQKELRAAAAAAAPPPKPKPVTAAAARSATKASPASLSGSRAKAASSPPPEPSPVQASPPPPTQPPPPPPRPAWQRYVDEASGMPYWHHEASGTSTWTDPTAPMPMAVAAGPAREECAIS
jgi:hypothetical protein